jgi:plastocyanin
MRTSQLLLAAAIVLPTAAAVPADPIVGQKGRVFSELQITVARGEPIVFLNNDTVPHNVMSTTPGNSFDLGAQGPGTATPVSFDVAGVVAVICAIHPRMHMTVTVTN